jgi:outer membrane protein assembly factor BamD
LILLPNTPRAELGAYDGTGQFVISKSSEAIVGRAARFVALATMVLVLAGCNLFGGQKLKQEAIIPPETLYQSALADMDAQRYGTAISALEKLSRQHPYSEYNERAKLMEVYANYRIGRFDEAILAADRFLALYPSNKDVPYVLWIKGTSYYAQIKDITRDQQLTRDAIDTYTLLVSNYPESEHAKDAHDKLALAFDNLAGKEMSVGRYYLGNGQYPAAIKRFQTVAERYQTSTHIEEALYRLTEANLLLGLTHEAQTAAAVLGHNYPSSSWYKQALDLLKRQGLSPQINESSTLAGLRQG